MSPTDPFGILFEIVYWPVVLTALTDLVLTMSEAVTGWEDGRKRR